MTIKQLEAIILKIFWAIFGEEWVETHDGAGCLDPFYEYYEDRLQDGLSEDEAFLKTVDYFRM